jgi:antibiotic biosynthesis monooxygenase (ABM) superfamily enzyme
MSSINNDSVTVVVTRRVKSGYELQYENWLKRLFEEAKSMKGYIGATVQKPAPGTTEYTSVFRFDNVENLRKFEESEIRARYLREVVDYVEADAIWRKFSGLEFWFLPPRGTIVPQPSRFRMALVMILVVNLNWTASLHTCRRYYSILCQAFRYHFNRDFLDDICSYATSYQISCQVDLS